MVGKCFSKCSFCPWQVRSNLFCLWTFLERLYFKTERNSNTLFLFWFYSPFSQHSSDFRQENFLRECSLKRISFLKSTLLRFEIGNVAACIIGSYFQTDKYAGSGSVSKAKRYQIIKSNDTISHICVTTHTAIRMEHFFTINFYLLAAKY